MRAVRDTFLHFLSDNLSQYSIPVNAVRRDKDSPSSDLIQANAVNVHFLNAELDTLDAGQQVSIDVVNDNELTAVDWTEKVWNILSSAFYTPKYDYTNPASPVALGTNITWSQPVRFRWVYEDFYVRYSCLLMLKHKIY